MIKQSIQGKFLTNFVYTGKTREENDSKIREVKERESVSGERVTEWTVTRY